MSDLFGMSLEGEMYVLFVTCFGFTQPINVQHLRGPVVSQVLRCLETVYEQRVSDQMCSV